MSLQLRKSSNWWYAQFVVNGKRQTFNLDVRIVGERPRSINKKGDKAFEASRIEAQAAHDRRKRELESDQHGIQAAQTVVKLRTGLGVQFPMLEGLVSAWEKIPRKRGPSDRYVDQCRRVLNRFVTFMKEHHPGVSQMVDISEAMAAGFMAAEEQRGISGKQYNDELTLLRSAHRRLHQSLGIMMNPFYAIPFKEANTVHHRPYSPEELGKICEAAQGDGFMRPLVVCAMCTAMRLGDCALLRWKDVNLDEDYIRVKTRKTRLTAEIPIFPPLRAELEKADHTGEYVFPEQATRYRRSQADVFSYRLKKILIKAGFARSADGDKKVEEPILPALPEDEIRMRVYAYIDQMKRPINKPKKPEIMRQVFDAYMAGKKVPEICESLGVSRGSASNYLNELEDATHVAIVNRRPLGVRSAEGQIRAKRPDGIRRASTMGFRSFRTTWITLALIRGVPMDLVRVVTGHSEVEVVLKHYFRPRREEIRAAFQRAMPALLTGNKGPLVEKTDDIQRLLAEADEKTAWETIQKVRATLPSQQRSLTE